MENVVELRKRDSESINWSSLVIIIGFHGLSVWALFTFSWQNLAAALLLWWLSGSIGIGLGYHRFLTHRGYSAPKWFEYLVTICGTLALQSGPISWVTTHRLHHAFTDTNRDPHSPNRGFYWAHIGWILKGPAQIINPQVRARYSPDLVKFRFHAAADRYYWMTSVVVGLGLWALGGWSMVLWGIFLRTTILWHGTWLVNSATHMWGGRRFETKDTSRNNPLVAAITFGEGWHNNHHAYPRSARHGLKRFEFDINWIQIRLLEKIGLLSDVHSADLDKRKRTSDRLRKAA